MSAAMNANTNGDTESRPTVRAIAVPKTEPTIRQPNLTRSEVIRYECGSSSDNDYIIHPEINSRSAEKICATLVAISTNHVIATP